MSQVLAVDTSAPLEGVVNCPQFVQGTKYKKDCLLRAVVTKYINNPIET